MDLNDKPAMLCKALSKPSQCDTSRFDKACAARCGRLHEPELVEEFGLSDACGGAGQGRLHLHPPWTPRLPAGHTRRRCGPSPSLTKPLRADFNPL